MRTLVVYVTAVVAALSLFALPGPMSGPAAAEHGGALVCPHVLDRPILDGVVSPSEYGESFLDPTTGLALYMQYEGDNMSLAVVSPGQGWVSLHLTGLVPEMPGEDLLMGYVDNGTTVLDMIDHGWEVHLDTDVGGSQDVLSAAGRRDGGGTVIEMTVPLNSTDPNDHRFEPLGTYAFRLAYNASSSDPMTPPTAHTEAKTFQVGARPPSPRTPAVMSLEAQGDARAGSLLVLYSRLETLMGVPVAGRTVSLHERTTFGRLLLDEGVTDRNGEAEHLITPAGSGELTLVADFAGDADYATANVTVTLRVAAGPPTVPSFPVTAVIVGVVAAVVGSVWASYAFVGVQVYRISRAEKMQSAREGRKANETEKRR